VWSPDATELAFTSDHEGSTSPYSSDIYGIRPDGSQLRRITNPPALSTITSGSQATGTVQVNLSNPTGINPADLSLFLIYVQGATSATTAILPPFGDTATVQIPNVADLGGSQYVVVTWSGGGCSISKFIGTPVDVQAGATVNTDIAFDGTVCNTATPSANNVLSLSWQRTGSTIGYSVDSRPALVDVSVGTPDSWFTSPGLISSPVFSPVDDQVLYENIGGGANGIFLVPANGSGPGTQLFTDTTIGQNIVWLPDGSGFLYLKNGDIWLQVLPPGQNVLYHDDPSGMIAALTLAPDASALVYELQQGSTSDLIIINDLLGTPQISPLTNDGRSSNPTWSRTTVTTPDTQQGVYLPLVLR
jgi:hypothetical protein